MPTFLSESLVEFDRQRVGVNAGVQIDANHLFLFLFMLVVRIKPIIAQKPHIFTMQGGKWTGKTEVPHVDAEIGV